MNCNFKYKLVNGENRCNLKQVSPICDEDKCILINKIQDTYCYCKKCKEWRNVKAITIDKEDKIRLTLDCNHIRVYQLITSKEDYK